MTPNVLPQPHTAMMASVPPIVMYGRIAPSLPSIVWSEVTMQAIRGHVCALTTTGPESLNLLHVVVRLTTKHYGWCELLDTLNRRLVMTICDHTYMVILWLRPQCQ